MAGLREALVGKARGVRRRLVDLVVPPLCLACQTPLADGDSICGVCWRKIDFIRPPLCDVLGIPLGFAAGEGRQVSAAALAYPPDYARARAAARFDGVMRDLIHAFKYGDRHDARRLFGRWLAEAGRELTGEADILVPVPLARLRLFNRRFNQAAMLANELSAITGKPVALQALRRTRATPSQVGLTPEQRRRNVAGAFVVTPAARGQIEGRAVLLVDDVITTGATVEACARALRSRGARRVDVLALARVTDTVG